MTDVTITIELLREIAGICNPHLKAMNDDVTVRWSEAPDEHFTLAVGWSVAVMLGSLSEPAARQSAVTGINAIVGHTGYALTPATGPGAESSSRQEWLAEQRAAFEAGDADRWREFVKSDELIEAYEDYKRQDWQRWLNDHDDEEDDASHEEPSLGKE